MRKVILFHRQDYSRSLKNRRWGRTLGIVRDLVGEIRSERYAAVLDFQGLLKSGLATFLAHGKVKLGSPSTYGRMKEGAGFFSRQVLLDRRDRHLVERHLLVVQQLLGTSLRPEPIRIDFTRTEMEKVHRLIGDDPFVLFHPFASWQTRTWPFRSWAQVASTFAMKGLRVALAGVGGASQERVKEEIGAGVQGGVIDVMGTLTLRELALAMARSEAVLAVDSGPMHLASAMGTRVVALFGPTDPVRLGPFGPFLTPSGEEDMGRTGMVVTAGLPCQPCMMRRCPIGTPCQERLSPDIVVGAFDEVMKCQVKAGQARDLAVSDPWNA